VFIGAAHADPYPVDERVDAEHYRFDIHLSDDSDAIAVRADIDLRLLDDEIDEITLDLVGVAPDGDGTGMTVHAVTAGGEALAYEHAVDRLTIAVPEEAAGEGFLRVQITYDGQPATGLIIGDNKYGDRSFFSDNWPNKARHWLATVDHVADKATSEFIVTAPTRLRVVSNGTRMEESRLGGGLTRTHWRQSVPISPWLYALGAAEFAVQRVGEYDHRPIETWVYRQDRDAGFHDFAVPTKDALAFYSEWVGPFEYEKLANIQSNSVGGGMEAASAIFYGDDSVSGASPRTRRWQTVIVHEIAHQWFGNSVTEASWDEVWLSEGFATYFTFLYFEHARGKDAFDRYLTEARTRIYEFAAEHPGYTIVHDNLVDMRDVTTRQIYDKGAWTLHMLRQRVGDAAWWAGIRDYYARHRNGLATTADFRRAMEAACACDLGPFLDYWLHTESTPRFDGTWHYDADEQQLRVTLEARGLGAGALPLTLEAAVYHADSPTPEIIEIPLTESGGETRIAAPGRPRQVLLDPRTRMLAAWNFEERSPETTASRSSQKAQQQAQQAPGGTP
jgi:aminopeptidase N